MRVQLIVVRGKPEGKVIPLAGPRFRIGRGETCHLRPNSELVSREHAEITIERNAVIVRDLGSRNGTLVNGKALTAEPCKLKDRDLVQVGPLTFAVSILEASAPAVKPAPPTPPAPTKKSSPEEIAAEEISSWLLGDPASLSADEKTKLYRGETVTFSAVKNAAGAPSAQTQPVKPPSTVEYERQTEGEVEIDEHGGRAIEDDETNDSEDAESGPSLEDPFMDPSNPFYAAKKAQKEQAKSSKAAPTAGAAGQRPVRDTSDAANEILRKLMERRRPPRP
jgi:predicted component of type VI protein secretion system